MQPALDAAALGQNVIFASGEGNWVRRKYRLTDLNRDLNRGLKEPVSRNQCKCGRVRRDGLVKVQRALNLETGELSKPYYSGVVRCGSVWSCAVCAAKIAARRRTEIEQALARAAGLGLQVYHVTVTIRHHARQSLQTLLDALLDAWRRTKSGRRWMAVRDRIGYVGMIRALEVTFGSNGWHPHLHCLLVVNQSLKPETLEDLRRFLFEGIRSVVVGRHGLDTPSYDKCVKIQGGASAGAYVSKMGLAPELVGSLQKNGHNGHRTPWQILHDYGTNREEADRSLWIEYSRAMKGRHQITWTPDLKSILQAVVLSDEDAVNHSDQVAVSELTIDGKQWDRLQTIPGIRGDLLFLVERDGADAAKQFVGQLLGGLKSNGDLLTNLEGV